MTMKRMICRLTLSMAIAPESTRRTEVQIEAPAVAPGVKPVTVEHIKVHSQSLEVNRVIPND